MSIVEPFAASRRNAPPAFQPRASDFPPGNCFSRLLVAKVIAQVTRREPHEVAMRMWPHDRVVPELLERAATAPAMTTVAGWAAELAQKHVYDMLKALYPYSAAIAMLERGLVLTFDGTGQITFPGFAADIVPPGFIAEGQPIPVFEGVTHPGLLQPYKAATIGVLTREMVEGSNAERMITDLGLRMLGVALDKALLGSAAASAASPAGLRYNIAATAPATGAADQWNAFVGDAGALADAVSPVASNAPLVYIASPGRRVRTLLYYMRDVGEPDVYVFASNALAANEFVCVATAALVAAFNPNPDVETSKASSLHMEDTNPQPLLGAGPVKSMFQTDSIALKLRWPISWALRDPRGIAWMNPTGW